MGGWEATIGVLPRHVHVSYKLPINPIKTGGWNPLGFCPLHKKSPCDTDPTLLDFSKTLVDNTLVTFLSFLNLVFTLSQHFWGIQYTDIFAFYQNKLIQTPPEMIFRYNYNFTILQL